MPADQFAALVSLLPEIDKALAAKGVELPRPLYDATSSGGGFEGAKAEDEEKPKKANYEATDDEEE